MRVFRERLTDSRPLLYDGGFGSQLFARGIELVNSTIANDSHPDAVREIHRAYIDAGSEAVGTNTFVASALHLEMADRTGSAADDIARQAAEHARKAVDASGADVYVGGSIGPSPGAIEADSGDTVFGIANEKVRDAHARLSGALAEGGVDFFMIETQFSANEAAIAVDEARRHGLPIAVSMTYKSTKDRKTGDIVYRTDWGHSPQTLIDALASGKFSDGENLLPYVDVVGLNCGAETQLVEHTGMAYAIEGTRQTKEAIAGREGPDRIVAYPNAGMPTLNKEMETTYSQTPDDMALDLAALVSEGASIVGGCCGTGPDHIASFRVALDRNEGK